MRRRTRRSALTAAGLALCAASTSSTAAGTSAPPAASPAAVATPVLAAAGDIACSPRSRHFNGGRGTERSCRQGDVADLLARIQPDAVLALGDLQYECGEAANFRQSFDRSWGRHRALIRPAIGNHEYGRSCGRNDSTPYFDYFGKAAGDHRRGWYSFDLGAWHLVSLNSECSYGSGATTVGGCGPTSAQVRWMREDLAAHRTACTLAYWHEPRWSSGKHGNAPQMATIWDELASAGVELVLAGHTHGYERFAPAGVSGRSERPVLNPLGVRQLVVGTGGKSLDRFTAPLLPGEELRQDHTYGVLALTLHPRTYTWEFVPVEGGTFRDHGIGVCH